MKTASFKMLGPILVAVGAFLWATDSVFRAQVITRYSPFFIVWMNHLFCAPFFLASLWRCRGEFRTLKSWEWFCLLILGIGSSVVAMALYTASFAASSSFTVPVLLQKTQPLMAVTLAWLCLGEKLPELFWTTASLCVLGALLISFGQSPELNGLTWSEWRPAVLALGAAMLWAAGTVAGRFLVGRRSFEFVIAMRYFIGTLALSGAMLFSGELSLFSQAFEKDFGSFLGMGIIPGYLALFIYYRGLTLTPASIATFCELAFPLGAITINWIFLNETLSWSQGLGAVLLLGAIVQFSRINQDREASIPW